MITNDYYFHRGGGGGVISIDNISKKKYNFPFFKPHACTHSCVPLSTLNALLR